MMAAEKISDFTFGEGDRSIKKFCSLNFISEIKILSDAEGVSNG